MQEVKITPKGVWINGHKLNRVLSADIKNISPTDPMELVLRIEVDRADIQYGAGGSRDKLSEERRYVYKPVSETVFR